MSTIKTINVVHPSSATNNIVTDSSGNVAIGGTLTVSGVSAVAVAPGTSGNVLTSNGTAWTSATAPVINNQTFDSSGTWTKPAGYSANSRVFVQAWGAGGSGGRSTTANNASGGGGGGYNERWLNLSQLGATETITIGAGGAARTGSNQNGATGGNTTVGSLVTAYGGGGGGGLALNAGGGGGGGQLSAGTIGNPGSGGRPYVTVRDSDDGWMVQGNGVPAVSFSSSDLAAFKHGGGGGNGINNASFNAGAESVWGGGGGGGGTTGTGGTSSFGGNGGASAANGTNGTQPGGGGGAATGTSGAGGAGRVIITVFPA
jgi:hypothetical protein